MAIDNIVDLEFALQAAVARTLRLVCPSNLCVAVEPMDIGIEDFVFHTSCLRVREESKSHTMHTLDQQNQPAVDNNWDRYPQTYS